MEALSVADIPFAEALCDVSPVDASSKRIRKSVDRTLRHLDRCIELKQSSQVHCICHLIVNNFIDFLSYFYSYIRLFETVIASNTENIK